MQKKFYLPKIEFYITNTCNFNCDGCNRFNNWAFSGNQKWKDFSHIYQQWSERLDFGRCLILGGEPMTTPDYMDWLTGIQNLWPNTEVRLLSNGSLLAPDNRALYDWLSKNPGLARFDIGLHNRSRLDQMIKTVTAWLVGPVTITRFPDDLHTIENAESNWKQSYDSIRDSSWPDCDTWDSWHNLPDSIRHECSDKFGFDPDRFGDRLRNFRLTDSNGIFVNIYWESDFHQGALIFDHATHRFKLHSSNVQKAHDVCHSKFCHHFDSGLLYKCGPVGLFPKFFQQFEFDLTQTEIDIMHAYQPASLDMDQGELEAWLDHVRDPIAQCQFCPEQYQMREIFAAPKKMVFKKKPRLTTNGHSAIIVK